MGPARKKGKKTGLQNRKSWRPDVGARFDKPAVEKFVRLTFDTPNLQLLESAKEGDLLGVMDALGKGANILVRDEKDRTAWELARSAGNKQLSNILIGKAYQDHPYDVIDWMVEKGLPLPDEIERIRANPLEFVHMLFKLDEKPKP